MYCPHPNFQTSTVVDFVAIADTYIHTDIAKLYFISIDSSNTCGKHFNFSTVSTDIDIFRKILTQPNMKYRRKAWIILKHHKECFQYSNMFSEIKFVGLYYITITISTKILHSERFTQKKGHHLKNFRTFAMDIFRM